MSLRSGFHSVLLRRDHGTYIEPTGYRLHLHRIRSKGEGYRSKESNGELCAPECNDGD